MIAVGVRVFHLDQLPRCSHGRVLCTACGLDPFDAHPRQQAPEQVADRAGVGFIPHDSGDAA